MPNLLHSFLLGYGTVGVCLYALSRVGFARRRRLEPSAIIVSHWDCVRICAAWPASLALYAYYSFTGYYDHHH